MVCVVCLVPNRAHGRGNVGIDFCASSVVEYVGGARFFFVFFVSTHLQKFVDFGAGEKAISAAKSLDVEKTGIDGGKQETRRMLRDSTLRTHVHSLGESLHVLPCLSKDVGLLLAELRLLHALLEFRRGFPLKLCLWIVQRHASAQPGVRAVTI